MRKYLYENSKRKRYLWVDVGRSRTVGVGVSYQPASSSGYTYKEEGYNMSRGVEIRLGPYLLALTYTWKDLKTWYRDHPDGLYADNRDWPPM